MTPNLQLEPLLPETIRRHAAAVYAPMAMLAGMQLDVFTPLRDGPLDAQELAEALGVDHRRLERLLYALVSAGLLTVDGGHFANTPEAHRFLVRGMPTYMGGMHELWSDLWAGTLKTAESIRTGVPQAKHDFQSMPLSDLAAFLRGLHPSALAAGRVLVQALQLQHCQALLDVGGGSGGLAIAACEAVPHLRATVVDLPTVTPLTRPFVVEAGLADRVDIASADLIDAPFPGAFDVAILRNLIQTMSAEQASRVIRHTGAAVTKGGQIHITGWILDDSRLAPQAAVEFDVCFLNLYDEGAAYTAGVHRQWLEAAGFVDFCWGETPPGSGAPGMSLVTARKR